jgi:KUP system potassium uptake protein
MSATSGSAPTVAPSSSRALVIAALGVVYGDIGTSPLYALRECFHEHHGLAVTPTNVLGVLSLIVWSLVLVITVKYIAFVMRADNRGEGGILALMALIEPQRSISATAYKLTVTIALGLFGAALLYGDGIITPAISVLSAVEGLEIAAPGLTHYILPITVAILIGLFIAQQTGTASIGRAFGPVMVVWFLVLGTTGVLRLVQQPHVLAAISPHHAWHFFLNNHWHAFIALGSVFLVVTGGEALYADMGHFGRSPIKIGWYTLVLPALVLQYLGQGALLLDNPAAIANPFYLLAPDWALYPLVALATAATVIASQALITGAFSLSHQAIQLGFLPRLRIVQTSAAEIGQIYVPFINWAMLIGTLILVLGFGSSSRLAAAYGIAVTGTMVITTVLLYSVARRKWGWGRLRAGSLVAFLLVLDLAFFTANVLKIPHGGWLPLILAMAIFFVSITWKRGRSILAERLTEQTMPLTRFLETCTAKVLMRVPGDAIFMSGTERITPLPLAQNVRHNKVLHERILIVTVSTRDVPHMPESERLVIEELRSDVFHASLRYGFMEQPNVPEALFGKPLTYTRPDGTDGTFVFREDEVTFFFGHDTLLATERAGMAIFRERLFAFMARNSQRASSYFHIPAERVIQIGSVVEL